MAGRREKGIATMNIHDDLFLPGQTNAGKSFKTRRDKDTSRTKYANAAHKSVHVRDTNGRR